MTCPQTLDGHQCQETKPGHKTHYVEMDPARKSPWFQGIKVYWIHPLKEREHDEPNPECYLFHFPGCAHDVSTGGPGEDQGPDDDLG